MGDAGKILRGLGLYLQATRNCSRVVWPLQASESLGGKAQPLNKQAVCPHCVHPASATRAGTARASTLLRCQRVVLELLQCKW